MESLNSTTRVSEINTTPTEKEAFLTLKELCGTCILRYTSSTILWANEAALKQFSLTPSDISYTNRQMLFANYEDYMHLNASLQAYGYVRNYRCLMKRLNNTSFWANLTCAQKNIDGQVIYEDMLTDISEQVTLENQLHENKLLLAKVGEELDRFVYSASHELRGPICTTKGLLSLLRYQSPSPTLELFDMMEACLNKLENNIDKLSEVSKNNNVPITIESTSLNDFVNSLVHQLRFHKNFTKISFDIQIPKDYQVYTDSSRLWTILHNVIENCLDFCDLNKKRSFVNIHVIAKAESCTIEILDNGIGIQKHSLPHIFHMFYRGHSVSKGSGLGLYTAREATIKLGGTIEIQSEFKVGTSLRISIPQLKEKN